MNKLNNKKRTIKSEMTINPVLDSHKWTTKMEIMRLISGKPELKIKAIAH